MADSDKLFVAYRTHFGLSIKPRGAAGWWATLAWLAALVPPTAGFMWIMASHPTPQQEAISVIGYIALTLAWSAMMIRWTYLRSEVIDLRSQPGNAPTGMDRDALFTCYRIGGHYRFAPRGAGGWWALAAWTVPLAGLFIALAALEPKLGAGPWLIPATFAVVLPVWLWALFRWLKPRSHFVTIDR